MDSIIGLIGLYCSGILAGAVNSVAGGGTLISFPSLVAYGIPSIHANATNTAAVCPGSISSAFAYRHDLPRERVLLWTLLIPSILGGIFGAVILSVTPESVFRKIVPFLVLFATVIFGARDRFTRLVRIKAHGEERVTTAAKVWGFSFQFFVATYGGYFGAGIGILMLASLGVMGFRDIHRMNALKTILGSTANGVALVYFIIKGLVVWKLALLMGAGAILGGYAGARLAKKVNQAVLRAFIVAVGILVSAWLFYRSL